MLQRGEGSDQRRSQGGERVAGRRQAILQLADQRLHRLTVVAQQLAGEEVERLDAVGALVDRQDAGVAVVLRGRSEEHTSELQSLMRISYAVFCLKKKKHN